MLFKRFAGKSCCAQLLWIVTAGKSLFLGLSL